MKVFKKVSSLVLLVLPALLPFFAGCGGSYQAEKLYWNATKKYASVMQKPETASPADFTAMISAVREVVKRYPGWENSAKLQYQIGTMFAARDDYATAEKELKDVYMNFPAQPEVGARSLFSIGSIYEHRGDWNTALAKYNELIDRYPASETGLQTLMYLAKHYQKNKQAAEAEKAFTRANRAYTSLIEAYPYTNWMPSLQSLLIATYGEQGKWKEAIAMLEATAKKYPDGDAAPVSLYRAAIIYRDVLKDQDKALALFRKIIQEYPKSKLGKNVQLDIGNLAALKGDMVQAQQEFNTLLEKYPDDTSLCAVAQMSVAMGYQKAGRWEDALREYQKLQQTYPLTKEALSVPIVVARHYQDAGNNQEATRVMNDAITGYRALLNGKINPQVGVIVFDALSTVHGMLGQWPQAVEDLNALRHAYPRDQRAPAALLKIGVIYQEKLVDISRAREVYQQFTQEYPSHPMLALVQSVLEKLPPQ
jgi:TolA-binding protein